MQEHILHQFPLESLRVVPARMGPGGDRSEAKPIQRPNASAAHLLVEVLDGVAAGLEDNRAGVVVSHRFLQGVQPAGPLGMP